MDNKLVGILQQREVKVRQHGRHAGLLVQCELELPIDVGLDCSAYM